MADRYVEAYFTTFPEETAMLGAPDMHPAKLSNPSKFVINISSLLIKTALLALALILIQDASLAQQNAYVSGPSGNPERQVWEPGRLSRAGTPEAARLTALVLAYHNRAHLYAQISNIAEQRAHYRKAIEIMKKAGDDAIASLAYGRLGDSYIEDYPDSAMIYIDIALEKGGSAGYKRLKVETKEGAGSTFIIQLPLASGEL